MYNIDDNILDYFGNTERELSVKAIFNEGNQSAVTITDDIISYKITGDLNNGEGLALGNTSCRQLDLELYIPNDKFKATVANAMVKVFIGANIEGNQKWVQLGVFKVDTYTLNNGYNRTEDTDKQETMSITAFDGMYYAIDNLKNYKYQGSTYYATTIIRDICNKAGVSFMLGEFVKEQRIANPNTIADLSTRELLGYLAGVIGTNAVFDREGRLKLKAYKVAENVYPITDETQYLDEFTLNNHNELTIGYVTSGSENNVNGENKVFTEGGGTFGINFENPFITEQSYVDDIFEYYKNTNFVCGSVRHIGNLQIEMGDIVDVVIDDNNNTVPMLVLNETIEVSGGLSVTESCEIEQDIEQSFTAKTTIKTVSRDLETFDKKYSSIIESLIGNKSGFVKMVYYNDALKAIAIVEQDVDLVWIDDGQGGGIVDFAEKHETASCGMWVWSYAGMYFTNDAMQSVNYAITIDPNTHQGKLYADDITGKYIYGLDIEAGSLSSFGNDEDADLYIKGGDMYLDNEVNGTIYRTFIQGANKDNGGFTQAFAVQVSEDGENYYNNWRVNSNGSMFLETGNMYISDSRAIYSNDDKLPIVYIDANKSCDVNDYARQGNLNLLTKGSNSSTTSSNLINMYFGSSDNYFRFRDEYVSLYGDSAKRMSIRTPKGMLLDANNGNNAIFLYGSGTHINGRCRVHGNCVVDNDLEVVNIDASGNYTSKNGAVTAKGLISSQNITASGSIGAGGNITASGSMSCSGISTSSISINNATALQRNNGLLFGIQAEPLYHYCTYFNLANVGNLIYLPASGYSTLGVSKSGNVGTTSSSQRYKENITTDINEELNPNKLYELPISQYNYKKEFEEME